LTRHSENKVVGSGTKASYMFRCWVEPGIAGLIRVNKHPKLGSTVINMYDSK
jgi:hypothetical protein